MKTRFRVGLVGAGYVSRFHASALRRLSNVELIGITDLDPQAAANIAREYQIPGIYPSLREMADAGLDVVHVLTPPHSHAEVALEAMELGCDVLIEKPLATSVEECDLLIATAARLGRTAGVNHSLLGDPQTRRALKLVRDGRIGEVISADIFCSSVYPEYRGGRLPPHYRDGGYPFRDLGVHALYLLREFLGEIRGVESSFASRGGDPNLSADEWRCSVQCKNGSGSIHLSWNIRPLQYYATIHGTLGSIRVDFAQLHLTRRRTLPLPGAAERVVNALAESLPLPGRVALNVAQYATGRLHPNQGLHNYVHEFYQRIAAHAPPPTTLEDGREAVRWTEEVALPADAAKIERAKRYSPKAGPVVLVTGASGFVGRHLVRQLIGAGDPVRVLARREKDCLAFADLNVEVVLGDIGDPVAVDDAVRGATLVYHLAAATSGGWSQHECGTVAGTRNVVDSCIRHSVPKLVYMSSLSVIDWIGGRETFLQDERCALEPQPELRGNYTQAKLAAERIVSDAVRDRALKAVIVRPGQIFGPEKSLAAASGAIKEGKRLWILGTGNLTLPLVHVEDVVDSLLLAAKRGSTDGAIFHIVDETPVTQLEMAKQVAASTGAKVTRIPQPLLFLLACGLEAAGRILGIHAPLTRYKLKSAQSNIRFDCTRARERLGWTPRIGVEEGLRLALSPGEFRPSSSTSTINPKRTKNMNLLITGASGFLGSHIVERAVMSGHRVRAFVRKTSKTDRLESLGVEIVRGDLKDQESLNRAVQGIDAVIHAASSMDGVPQEMKAATVEGTRALLDAAERTGVEKFIHISSIGIYAVGKLGKDETITEDYPLEENPRFQSDYVTTKTQSEAAALDCARHGRMSVVVLRPGILYGPRGKWTLPRTGYAFGENLSVIIGSGRNVLPVCYVENCAEAALLAAENTEVTDGIFNIIDDEQFTQAEFLQRIKSDANPRLRILRLPYAPAYVFAYLGERAGKLLGIPFPFRTNHMFLCGWRSRYSNLRARTLLGWRPAVGKEQALERTMNFHAARHTPGRRADLGRLQRPQVFDPPVNVCIVGCGVIAAEHLKILKGMDGIRVTGICDTNSEAAQKTSSRFGIDHIYSDIQTMIDSEKPEAVHIVTPPQSHAELAKAALRARCHVLVEKPMSVNSREAREMAETAMKFGARLCVDHNHLYDPVVVRARRIVESGELGDVLWVESYYGFDLGNNPDSPYMLPGGDRHWTFQLPGGLYQNLAAHPLSLLLDVLGKPTGIQASARYGRVLPHADTDELRIFVESSRAPGMAVVSLAASPRSQFLTIYGTKMTMTVDVLNKWIISQRPLKGMPKAVSRSLMHLSHGATVIGGTARSIYRYLRGDWTYADGMELLIRDYYASLRDNHPSPVSLEEAVWTMDIMDEVWRQIGNKQAEAPIRHDSYSTMTNRLCS